MNIEQHITHVVGACELLRQQAAETLAWVHNSSAYSHERADGAKRAADYLAAANVLDGHGNSIELFGLRFDLPDDEVGEAIDA